MQRAPLLTPNEVAALANTSKGVIDKAIEQKVLPSVGGRRARPRLLPFYAVALAATVESLGRRLTVEDKKLVARKLARLTPAALKTAKIEVFPCVVVHVGSVSRRAVERAERYTSARDNLIERVEGVQGGRPVIKGTRLTVSAIYGRLSSGELIDDLVEDYPGIPRKAFEAAYLYGKTHPKIGRPSVGGTEQSA